MLLAVQFKYWVKRRYSEYPPIFYRRLKKIQEKKKQLRERTEKEIAARLAALGPISEPTNMLNEEADEDLLFEWDPRTERPSQKPHHIYSLCL